MKSLLLGSLMLTQLCILDYHQTMSPNHDQKPYSDRYMYMYYHDQELVTENEVAEFSLLGKHKCTYIVHGGTPDCIAIL